MIIIYITLLALLGSEAAVAQDQQSGIGGIDRAAVCIGLLKIDRVAHGWDGHCPGADVDARSLEQMMSDRGIQTVLLLDADATVERFESTVIELAEHLHSNGLLIISISGHGGRKRDKNGDEPSGYDSTILFWDEQYLDDRFMDLLVQLPSGIRVLLISDTCHSEGHFRAALRSFAGAVGLSWGRIPPAVIPSSMTTRDGIGPELIQFAGCREDSYSYGGIEGGTWTMSLLAEFDDQMTNREWYDVTAATMPDRQTPVWVEFNATERFVNERVLR